MTHLEISLLVISIYVVCVLLSGLVALGNTNDEVNTTKTIIGFLFPAAFCLAALLIIADLLP
ncbi:hypothetical protein CHH67_21175 [Paenibacillus campinasensis]|uniref:Uncharacterized protein n=1 Tax=Paenibacillus campinasensis TaxID=66347 RepID=A0A268EI65_9BACL|nr:hypothetical protein CHH67_21175 [Paenibacillus campinasensis]